MRIRSLAGVVLAVVLCSIGVLAQACALGPVASVRLGSLSPGTPYAYRVALASGAEIPVARQDRSALVPLDGAPLEVVELGGGGQ